MIPRRAGRVVGLSRSRRSCILGLLRLSGAGSSINALVQARLSCTAARGGACGDGAFESGMARRQAVTPRSAVHQLSPVTRPPVRL